MINLERVRRSDGLMPVAGRNRRSEVPVVTLLRRRPPRIPDRVHSWTYVGLLAVTVATVATVG